MRRPALAIGLLTAALYAGQGLAAPLRPLPLPPLGTMVHWQADKNPDPQSYSAGANEFHGVGLIHAAGGDQRNFRERRLESPHVAGTTVRGARKYLNEIGTSFPRGHDFGWSQGAW